MTFRLEDEIRAALRPGRPDDEERAAWARAALERGAPAPRRVLHPGWYACAAALLLAVVFWPRAQTSRPSAPPPVHAQDPDVPPADDGTDDETGRRLRSTSVEEQRLANARRLEEEWAKKLLAEAPPKSWAIMTGGDSLHVANSVREAVRWADRLHPEAKHRFLVPLGFKDLHRGDVIVDRTPVSIDAAGAWFLQEAGLKDLSPDVRWLTLEIGGRERTICIHRDSAQPLVLPASVAFPRFEIPGRVILEDLNRSWRSFRRYYVRVRCREPKLDRWMEVVGAESAERYAPGGWVGVRLGGYVFHALRKAPVEQAAEEGKRLLVLRFAEGSTEYLDTLFTGLEVADFAQLAVPQAKRTVIEVYGRDGRVLERLLLPDASAGTRRALRALLAR